jgi:signal transduction histidine kinase
VALTVEPVRLTDTLERAVALLGEAARAADVTIVRRPPADGWGDCVFADRARLSQVAVNLLSNAIKYNWPGRHGDRVVGSGGWRQPGRMDGH